MAIVPKDAGALAAFSEALALCAREPRAAAEFRKLLDNGAPLFRADVDYRATMGAPDRIARFKPSDHLWGFLAAFARNGEADYPGNARRHGVSPIKIGASHIPFGTSSA